VIGLKEEAAATPQAWIHGQNKALCKKSVDEPGDLFDCVPLLPVWDREERLERAPLNPSQVVLDLDVPVTSEEDHQTLVLRPHRGGDIEPVLAFTVWRVLRWAATLGHPSPRLR
jgi:hypothetical protein